jgi:hypothetical protein
VNPRPHALDLLFPMRLGELSTEQSLLAGPVTLVGKIVRVVRRPDDDIDTASLALFDDPVASVNASFTGGEVFTGLNADVTVLSPGAVIVPIGIYK